jgi:quercetin dioxygenase-like cupin family protein
MTGPKLDNLMNTALEGAIGTEVVVSHCVFPPNFALPKHWHPGEEFVYILEGQATLWTEGEPAVTVGPGEVVKVPYKAIHTASTGDEGVVLVAFRVHEEGQPERVLVEDTEAATADA